MKGFDLITEADARLLEPGSTVQLRPGGHITPLARDTLRERRIVVVDDTPDADLLKLTPTMPVARVAVGSDHAGRALRDDLVPYLRRGGKAVVDLTPPGDGSIDYPDVAGAVALAVARGEADAGVAIDGGGIGSAMAANKIAGVRAAMCSDETTARYAREHNGAHVVTLGATLLTFTEARRIVDVFLSASIREPRYIRRLAKLHRLERDRGR